MFDRTKYMRAYIKNMREERRKLGLCTDCGETASSVSFCAHHLYLRSLYNKRYFRKHYDYMINRMIEYRRKMNEDRRCIVCGTPLIEDENKLCVNCCNIRSNKGSIKGGLNATNHGRITIRP